MKNYPNQISNFERIRGTLKLVDGLNSPVSPLDPASDFDLGYELVNNGLAGFRDLPKAHTAAELAARIAVEQAEPASKQSPQTTARELRRTLRDLGWLDQHARVTTKGAQLLATAQRSVEEQALLVEGLLSIVATNKDGSQPHHPVPALLKLLATGPSLRRQGLELALEAKDDSTAELNRVKKLYALTPAQRMSALGISKAQRDNAVKIFPTLAVTAGLVVKKADGYFALSQDGWTALGKQPPTAKKGIAQRRGRRTTVGVLVTSKTVARKLPTMPPTTLTKEEQERAAQRLKERTTAHQKLVQRTAALVGDANGELFEDPFSYDLVWVPSNISVPVILFEMKTIISATDAYAQVARAAGQLSYYNYFYVEPTWQARKIIKVAVFDADIPQALADYLEHEDVGALILPDKGPPTAPNPAGRATKRLLP